MVMGPTHAASGAAVWLLASPTLTLALTGEHLDPSKALVGAAVCAGSALLPDIDHPSSTVANSFGPLSKGLAQVVNAGSKAFVAATSGPRDRLEHGGHRTLTHTAMFAALLGVAVSSLAGAFGRYAVCAVLFFTVGLALRGLAGDWAKQQGWLGISAASLIVALGATQVIPHDGWGWLGIAVTVGCFTHDLGDMITRQGAPLLAPFVPRIGKRWYEYTTRPLSITAGGAIEYAIIAPLCWAAIGFGLIAVYSPGTLTTWINHL